MGFDLDKPDYDLASRRRRPDHGADDPEEVIDELFRGRRLGRRPASCSPTSRTTCQAASSLHPGVRRPAVGQDDWFEGKLAFEACAAEVWTSTPKTSTTEGSR